jgi:intracellular sulfur oxidation DsrE/DsrF family protein
MKLTKSDIVGGAQFVDAGLTHIMKRQSEGWNYVRP